MGQSGMNEPPRNFGNDLAWSLAGGHELFWSAVYQKAFPNLQHLELCDDLTKQKQGVDRVLYLSNGNVLYVDEKKRGRIYSDILLEVLSNEERNTPGWIEKDLTMDYLAYGFLPNKRCYLFPWPILRRAWLQFGDTWKRKYGVRRSSTQVGFTGIYHTVNVPVPIDVLQRAVTTAAIIDVSDLIK